MSSPVAPLHPVARAVQWINAALPWNQPKSTLTKRGARFISRTGGPQVFGGIGSGPGAGLKMRLDPASDLERAILLNATNNRLLQLYRRILRPGDVCIDAGANLGLLALSAARLVGTTGRVFAFECSPAMAARLRDHVQLNGLDQVTVIERGCWSSATTLPLYDFDLDEIDQASLGRRPDRQVVAETSVQTVRVDDAVDAAAVRLYKIDVEGAEMQTLLGSPRILAQRPHIILECNVRTSAAFDHHPIDLVDFILRGCPDYRLHLVRTKRLRPITREQLRQTLHDDPDKYKNVWFEPT